MKRILLALPLFLVVGLLFVELPAGNSSPNNISPTSAAVINQASPAATVSPTTPQNIAPTTPSKSKIDIGGGNKPKHSNDYGEAGEHEGFGEDDD